MSSEPLAIAARGVGKSYTILHQDERQFSRGKALARRLRHPTGGMNRETFWALRDLTFDIRQGEVVGIVGRNGAGKSTLLKLLSHITEPSEGQIGIWGRVGSLLEVGTGFHPELTGRENIYLNGSILGMKRSEIKHEFDAIVAFSGVERFLDTPVKRYSSGMYVRLAFSVAVHLKPEVLIVDEVLAVGDGDFQRRCLTKMNEVAKSGRTVLLVSHNMGSIQTLCPRALYLADGRLIDDGPAARVVGHYLANLKSIAGSADDHPDDREGDGSVRLREIRIIGESGKPASKVMGGEDLLLEMDYESSIPGRTASLLLNIYNDDDNAVTAAHTRLTRPDLPPLGSSGTFRCRLRRLPLTTGTYRVAVAVHIDGKTADYLPRAVYLDVAASIFYPTGTALAATAAAVHIDHAWDHTPEPALRQTEAHVEASP
ncbi:MAG: ABC transporter ATP-binding protein [Phycisphaerae bacterium]